MAHTIATADGFEDETAQELVDTIAVIIDEVNQAGTPRACTVVATLQCLSLSMHSLFPLTFILE